MKAIAFIPNPENQPDINHIDGNKVNNAISNLEWNTESENQFHAIKIGLRKNFKNIYTDPTIYHLFNKKTNKYFKGLISEFRKTHEIKSCFVYEMIKGQRKSTNGWYLLAKQTA